MGAIVYVEKGLYSDGHGMNAQGFNTWLNQIHDRGAELIRSDPRLQQFVKDYRTEIKRAGDDYQALRRNAHFAG